jgi:argininosuccinate synthase
VGQEHEGLEAIRQKALRTGAIEAYVVDMREEFVDEYLTDAIRANALYENKYPLLSALSRPVISKHLVRIAHEHGAKYIAHGCTGKGNDQVRFELTYAALDPSLEVIAPWKDPKWEFNDRESMIDYLDAHKIPHTGISKTKIYSEDGNLWHLSHEGGILEEPDKEHNYDMLKHTKTYEQAPNKPAYVTISFDKGTPVALDGKKMGSVELLEKLNKIAGDNACGLIDIVEDRLVGLKSRGVYETPGGTLLYKAHECLEQLVLDKETMFEKQKMAMTYANLVYNGQWFTPLRQAMDAFISETQKVVTGDVRLKLYKGNVIPAGMQSPYSLYDLGLGSFPGLVHDLFGAGAGFGQDVIGNIFNSCHNRLLLLS